MGVNEMSVGGSWEAVGFSTSWFSFRLRTARFSARKGAQGPRNRANHGPQPLRPGVFGPETCAHESPCPTAFRICNTCHPTPVLSLTQKAPWSAEAKPPSGATFHAPSPPPPLLEGFQTHRGVLRVGAGGLGCFRHFSSVPPIPLSGREMGAVREFGIPFYKALVKGVSERYGSWGVALQQKTVFNWQRGPASDFGHFHGILVGAAYWVGLHPHLNPTQSRWVSKP